MNEAIIEALEGLAGVWAVGGAVRDWAIGRPFKDLDIAVEGDVRSAGAAVMAAVGGHFFLMHPASQTARVAFADGAWVDIVPLPHGLEADLQRRDYTVNALAAPIGMLRRPAPSPMPAAPPPGVVDPTGGWGDLRAGIVRLTHSTALEEDPLRTLRGLRVATTLRFATEPSTWRAIERCAPLLARVSPERVRDEWLALLDAPRARDGVARAADLGLLDVVLPEWRELEGVTQNPYHHLDVWDHTLDVLHQFDAMLSRTALEPPLRLPDDLYDDVSAYLGETVSAPHTRRALIRQAMLMHDSGKPATRTEDGVGRVRFHGHEGASADTARDWAHRFRLSGKERDFLTGVVGLHMRPGALVDPGVTERAVKRFLRDAGPAAPALFILNAADRLAARGPWTTDEEVDTQVEGTWRLLRLWFEMKHTVALPLPLSGRDLMSAYNLPAGPRIGRLIQMLRDIHLDAPFPDRTAAVEAARGLLTEEEHCDTMGEP
ncbi:MAG TPA: HD domain-containing protein [Armatimonadota bacterium]|jgi:poly(A) polymerase